MRFPPSIFQHVFVLLPASSTTGNTKTQQNVETLILWKINTLDVDGIFTAKNLKKYKTWLHIPACDHGAIFHAKNRNAGTMPMWGGVGVGVGMGTWLGWIRFVAILEL